MGTSLWSIEGEPYQNDLKWVIWSNPFKLIRINEIWTRIGEMSEMKWNEWFVGFDFEPYGNFPMSWEKVSLWKWLDVSENESPYQIEWIQWEMNELKWIEWIEVKWRIWMKWARTILWESPYESIESVPIKVTWCEWKWKSLSKWMDSMRNEWIEVNRMNRGKMKDLKEVS